MMRPLTLKLLINKNLRDQPDIKAKKMPREMPEVTKINAPNPAHLRAVTLPVSEGTITLLPSSNILLYISAQGENFFPSFL